MCFHERFLINHQYHRRHQRMNSIRDQKSSQNVTTSSFAPRNGHLLFFIHCHISVGSLKNVILVTMQFQSDVIKVYKYSYSLIIFEDSLSSHFICPSSYSSFENHHAVQVFCHCRCGFEQSSSSPGQGGVCTCYRPLSELGCLLTILN